MTSCKVISLLSGKGGTGKSLMSAVLADLLSGVNFNVLLIDLDLSVRGVTSLFYYDNSGSIKLISKNELSVNSYLQELAEGKSTYLRSNHKAFKLGIKKHRGFSILPAVDEIDQKVKIEIFDFLNSENSVEILRNLIRSVSTSFDVILLDCGAGLNDLSYAANIVSDYSLLVKEEDQVSSITASNLISQLEQYSKKSSPFIIVNKSRGLKKEQYSNEIRVLGAIPFDMDVMNSFGASYFWDDIIHSNYRTELVRVWNLFCEKVDLRMKIHNVRTKKSSPPFDLLENRMQFITKKNRFLIIYLLFVSITSAVFAFVGANGLLRFLEVANADPFKTSSLLMSVISGATALYLSLARR